MKFVESLRKREENLRQFKTIQKYENLWTFMET